MAVAFKWRRRFDTFANGTLKPSQLSHSRTTLLWHEDPQIRSALSRHRSKVSNDAVEDETCAEEFIGGGGRI
ncbi:hypothetical protein EYF80_012275 [Liparis tanakae]|uniref:Uncharacterized protein n=1 Tax=Liparis tanakae TaxID=230148 RepID=A0A4Z2IIB0_9TELE|nr:hypothetical protein EYF80_012275 [Liparis tanakae]